MPRALKATLVGLYTVAIMLLFGMTACYIVLEPERVFSAGREATPLWAVVVMALYVVGGWPTGFLTCVMGKGMAAPRALAVLTLVIGGVHAAIMFGASTPGEPLVGDEANALTMQRDIWTARLPVWGAVLAPLAGAGAISFGASVATRTKRDDAERPGA